jgi:hypothetical protein
VRVFNALHSETFRVAEGIQAPQPERDSGPEQTPGAQPAPQTPSTALGASPAAASSPGLDLPAGVPVMAISTPENMSPAQPPSPHPEGPGFVDALSDEELGESAADPDGPAADSSVAQKATSFFGRLGW